MFTGYLRSIKLLLVIVIQVYAIWPDTTSTAANTCMNRMHIIFFDVIKIF